MAASVPGVGVEESVARYLSWYAGQWKGSSSSSKEDLAILALWYGPTWVMKGGGPVISKFLQYWQIMVADPAAYPTSIAMPTTYPTVPAQDWLELGTSRVEEAQDEHFWGIDPGGSPDFYARITINGHEYIEAMHEDSKNITPSNWLVWAPLDPANTQVSITYALWDEDVVGGGVFPSWYGDDDHCNIRLVHRLTGRTPDPLPTFSAASSVRRGTMAKASIRGRTTATRPTWSSSSRPTCPRPSSPRWRRLA